MTADNHLYRYALRMGDTAMVVSQRLCEQVGTAPMLEEEIAIANIGLDMLGQATAWLELAAKFSGEDKTADDLAYLRNERHYTNYLLAELENGDFAQIILRGYLLSAFLLDLYQAMLTSNVEEFVAIAQKSVKEVKYHCQHQADWVERLGLGTEESQRRLSKALEHIWPYTKELFE
ncbi:MAG: phenylacetate-CoA oxygenase subunit PaaI, partial [Gammaproteobacteria bacterium]